jgi:hypothetical protein
VFLNFKPLFPYLDPMEFAAVDLGFAISSTSIDASTTFRLMKEAIKSVVSTYFTKNIRNGIIVFGDQPYKVLDFGEALPSKDVFIMKIDAIRRRTGDPDLIGTMQVAKTMFESRGARPHAKKVLVIILDNAAGQRRSQISRAAKPLEYAGIRVIPVAVGRFAEPQQLESTTPLRDNIIKVPKTEDPTILGRKIINKVKKSK